MLLTCYFYSAEAQKAFYTPKGIVNANHTGKNQLHASLGWGGGIDANLSYALTGRFSLFASSTYNKGTRIRYNLFGNSQIWKNNNAFTGGLGYSIPMRKRYDRFELSAGYGRFKIDNYVYYPEYPSFGFDVTTGRYNSIFLVATVARQRNRFLSALSARFAFSAYSDLIYHEGVPYQGDVITYEDLKGFTFEPVITTGRSVGKVLLNLQLGAAIPLSEYNATAKMSRNNSVIDVYESEKFLYGFIGRLALQYNFDLSKKRKGD